MHSATFVAWFVFCSVEIFQIAEGQQCNPNSGALMCDTLTCPSPTCKKSCVKVSAPPSPKSNTVLIATVTSGIFGLFLLVTITFVTIMCLRSRRLDKKKPPTPGVNYKKDQDSTSLHSSVQNTYSTGRSPQLLTGGGYEYEVYDNDDNPYDYDDAPFNKVISERMDDNVRERTEDGYLAPNSSKGHRSPLPPTPRY